MRRNSRFLQSPRPNRSPKNLKNVKFYDFGSKFLLFDKKSKSLSKFKKILNLRSNFEIFENSEKKLKLQFLNIFCQHCVYLTISGGKGLKLQQTAKLQKNELNTSIINS